MAQMRNRHMLTNLQPMRSRLSQLHCVIKMLTPRGNKRIGVPEGLYFAGVATDAFLVWDNEEAGFGGCDLPTANHEGWQKKSSQWVVSEEQLNHTLSHETHKIRYVYN